MLYGEMSETTPVKLRTRNPARPPWHLQGKEEYIARLREVDGLTFDEIGFKVGCSGEGARKAYVRHLNKMPRASEKCDGAVSVGTEGPQGTPDAEGKGNSTEVGL